MSRILVTISRQLGSGGALIGQQVAERLGIRYVDREILRRAAAALNEDEKRLAEREERVTGFWESFFRNTLLGTPETGYIPPPFNLLYDQDIFSVEAAVIKQIAARESAVIVGRGGLHVLKGYPGLVNVFFHASKAFRIRRVMEIYQVENAKRALAMIDDSDRSRGKFVESMIGSSWTNALSYHLALDTGAAGFSNAVDMTSRLAEAVVKPTS